MTGETPASPSGHTSKGGVLVGPYCRTFEDAAGDLLRREVSAGALAVEYRVRCFLGEESVRAAAVLALAAEEGHFDGMLQAVFAAQPPEGSGGFTVAALIALGVGVGLMSDRYAAGVREGRWREWAVAVDERFQDEDAEGTPKAVLDGRPVDTGLLADVTQVHMLLRG